MGDLQTVASTENTYGPYSCCMDEFDRGINRIAADNL
jgi:hypothetical protein